MMQKFEKYITGASVIRTCIVAILELISYI